MNNNNFINSTCTELDYGQHKQEEILIKFKTVRYGANAL